MIPLARGPCFPIPSMISHPHPAAPTCRAKPIRRPGAAFRRVLLLAGLLLAFAAGRLPTAFAAGPVNPDDLVVFDFDNKAVDILGGGYNDTPGALTTVVSASVGSGTAFTGGVAVGTVSPGQQLFYWDSNRQIFVQVDLTTTAFTRSLVPVPASKPLVPANAEPASGVGNTVAWDFSTGTILYVEQGAPANSATSSIPAGVYRLNPALGTNTLVAGTPAGTSISALAVKQDGTIYGLLNQNSGSAASVVQITATGTFPRVDGTAGSTPAYVAATDLSWDFVNQQILLTDEGSAQANAQILRINPSTGARTLVASGNTAPATTYGGTLFNAPTDGFVSTGGRVVYLDETTATPPNATLNTLALTGVPLAAKFYTGQFGANAATMSIVPPTLPTISSPTATNNNSANTETLGGNVTSTGAAQTTPTVQSRGVVYSLTSTNANPTIGGTGVTQVAATAGTGVFTVSAGGLTSNTQYSYAAYVSTYYGLVYTAVGTFTTPSAPTVTTPTAVVGTNGTTATLGGNVTSDGNSAVTARGVVYSLTSANASPAIGGTGVTNLTAAGTTGVFTVGATGLTPGAPYSYAAYATNALGTTYTTVATFTTPNSPTVASPPTATNVTGTGATLNGNVTADGGSTVTARGFVYAPNGTDPNPTVGDGSSTTATVSGTTGTETADISGLANGTTYAFRAFATNAVGTTYSTAATFKTPAPPTANAQSVSVPFNTATAITLTGSDPNTPAQTLSYTVVTAPIHGTLAGTAPNLTYTPTAGYQGADSFTFTARDTSALTSSPATVSITVSAGTPMANGQSVSVAFNTAQAITLTATDPDSPALALTYTVTTAPAHGTLSGTAPNLTYTPAANYQGADSFAFTVSNGQKTSSAATVSITVAAGMPTANAQSVSTGFNTATAITLTGTDPDSPARTLTYTVATAPTHGTLAGTAPNLTYTPTANYQGADSFTFTVSNGQKTSAPATVSITVAVGTPTAIGQSVTTNLNTAKAITLTGTDPDSPAQTLNYSVVTQPTHGTLSGTAPNLTYTPTISFSGTDSFTFTVSNGQSTSAAATVSVTVVGAPYITSFTASGAVSSTVTINGNNFTGTTSVTFFRNVAASTFTVVNDTQITVVVPAAAKTGVITVITNVGSNTSSTKFQVTP